MHAKWLCFSLDVRHSGVTSQRQPRLCCGPGAQNGKGGPKWPELCIKTFIRLCTGISQNNHPCLLTLPFRTGRYYSCSECLPGGSKIIVTPLVRQVNDCWFKPRRLYRPILCWRELSRRRLLPAVSPAAGHLTTPTAAGLPGLCENFRPTTSKSSPILRLLSSHWATSVVRTRVVDVANVGDSLRRLSSLQHRIYNLLGLYFDFQVARI